MIFILVNVIVLSVLILLSGAFSATEIALSSSNRTQLKIRAETGDKKAKQILKIIEDPTDFFATTQLYITFIAFFCGAYAASSFTEPIVSGALSLGLPVPEKIAEPVVFVLVTITLTYFMLVFGELVPKRFAMRNATRFALASIGILSVLSKIVMPFVKLLSLSANLVLKVFRIKDGGGEGKITKEEIHMVLKSGTEQGSIAESERDILKNVLKFDNKMIKDAFVHRLDVVALPFEASFNEIVDVLINEKYSRLPIYEESIDNIVGILHMKDVMKYMAENPDTSGFDINSLLREPYFVPAFKKADELLREMQKTGINMAVVIDEYGGMMGIVTMEDLVEEIVGSIWDEYDLDERPDITPVGDASFTVWGTTVLKKVQSHFGVDLPVDEYDTLSGFLISLLGSLPAEDENPEVEYSGLLFRVERVAEKRIETVTVSIISK